MRRLTGLAVALLALTTGCAAPAEQPAPRGPAAVSDAPPGNPRYARAWLNTDRRPIDQLKAIGNAMVGLVAESGGLLVVGIDPATGHELWHQPATPATVTIGVVVHVAKIGEGKVAYFRPLASVALASRGFAQLVVADAQTGRDLAASPPGLFTTSPFACMHDQDACVLSFDGSVGKTRLYRLEAATGSYLTDSEDLRPWARLLDESGVVDLGDRPGNTLGWLHDGKLQWTIPISAAFPPGFSSDNGWTWHRYADQHVLVGSVFGAPLAITPSYVRDLGAGAAIAGIAEDTGEVRWRDLGSAFQCKLGDGEYPVRCRRRGIATSHQDQPTSFDGLDVTVEGFDPATGATTWSVPMGPAASLMDAKVNLPIAGPTQVVVDRPTGPIVLDYATGAVTPARAGATFWCMASTRYELAKGYIGRDGKQHFERPGGALAVTCDALGRRVDALPGLDATIAAGAHVGSHIVVAVPDGYVGFQVR